MQIGQLELSPHLPTLDALDAEFGWDHKQYAVRHRSHSGVPVDSTFSQTQPELPTNQGAASPTLDATTLDAIIKRPSLGRQASHGLARFLVVFCIGVAATLAWQLYGDAARAMIANSSPQLGWLAPQTGPVAPTAPVAQTTSEVVAPTAAASPDLQRLVLGLASVHQSIDQLAARLAADQQQAAGGIAKLQADEQEILHKLSATRPRPAAAPAPKPAPVTPPPSPSTQAH